MALVGLALLLAAPAALANPNKHTGDPSDNWNDLQSWWSPWHRATVMPYNVTTADQFGGGISMDRSGNTSMSYGNWTLVSGSIHTNYGTGATDHGQYVTVFTGAGSQWTQTAHLQDPDWDVAGTKPAALQATTLEANFGHATAVWGPWIAVSDTKYGPTASFRDGVIYMYGCGVPCYIDSVTRMAPWQKQFELTKPGAGDGVDGANEAYQLGGALAFDKGTGTLFASAMGVATKLGVYVYERTPDAPSTHGGWQTTPTLIKAPNWGTDDQFGLSLAAGNSMLLIGAPKATGTSGTEGGVAYVYTASAAQGSCTGGCAWGLAATLNPPAVAGDTEAGYDFHGTAVAVGGHHNDGVYGKWVAVSAPGWNDGVGQVHVYDAATLANTPQTTGPTTTLTPAYTIQSPTTTAASASYTVAQADAGWGQTMAGEGTLLAVGYGILALPPKLTTGADILRRGSVLVYETSGTSNTAPPVLVHRCESYGDNQDELSNGGEGRTGVAVAGGVVAAASRPGDAYDNRGITHTTGGKIRVYGGLPMPIQLVANCGGSMTTALVSFDTPLPQTASTFETLQSLEVGLMRLYGSQEKVAANEWSYKGAAQALWRTQTKVVGVTCDFLSQQFTGPPFKQQFDTLGSDTAITSAGSLVGTTRDYLRSASGFRSYAGLSGSRASERYSPSMSVEGFSSRGYKQNQEDGAMGDGYGDRYRGTLRDVPVGSTTQRMHATHGQYGTHDYTMQQLSGSIDLAADIFDYKLPDGSIVNHDGSVVRPDGSVVVNAGDTGSMPNGQLLSRNHWRSHPAANVNNGATGQVGANAGTAGHNPHSNFFPAGKNYFEEGYEHSLSAMGAEAARGDAVRLGGLQAVDAPPPSPPPGGAYSPPPPPPSPPPP